MLLFTLWGGICFSQTEINWRSFPQSPTNRSVILLSIVLFYQTQNEKLPYARRKISREKVIISLIMQSNGIVHTDLYSEKNTHLFFFLFVFLRISIDFGPQNSRSKQTEPRNLSEIISQGQKITYSCLLRHFSLKWVCFIIWPTSWNLRFQFEKCWDIWPEYESIEWLIERKLNVCQLASFDEIFLDRIKSSLYFPRNYQNFGKHLLFNKLRNLWNKNIKRLLRVIDTK